MASPWRTDARQARSRATEQRIVAAAMDLVGKHGFERLPVALVARQARVSIGGLYARYADKAALVHAIDERLHAEFDAALTRAMAPTRLAGRDVAGVVAAYVDAMVRHFVRRRELLAQVVLRARSTQDPHFVARVRDFNRRAHGTLCTELLARRDEIRHPDPAGAAAFGVMFVSAAAREAVLFGRSRLNRCAVPPRRLARELVRACCAYLGARCP